MNRETCQNPECSNYLKTFGSKNTESLLTCGERVFESDLKEYPFVCLTCDENKFEIELSDTDDVEPIPNNIYTVLSNTNRARDC